MRRSLAILMAAATAIGASAASFPTAQAAPLMPAQSVATSTNGAALEQVRYRDRGDWRGRHRHGDWGGHRHHRRGNFGAFPGFYFGFGFPQAYYRPHRYYRNYYDDCFRTWDGQLICR